MVIFSIDVGLPCKTQNLSILRHIQNPSRIIAQVILQSPSNLTNHHMRKLLSIIIQLNHIWLDFKIKIQ